jgi:PilZ domain
MLALGFAAFDVALSTTWMTLGAGAVAASLVLGAPVLYKRWLRWRLSDASREEDLPWQALLDLLEQRNRDRAAAGLPPEQPTKEEVGELLARLPALPDPRPLELPEDREFRLAGGTDRRAGHRRWGNPTEVHIQSSLLAGHLHGLVVNRSTGGLGIFADKEVPPGTSVQIRAAEAPVDVASVRAEVRHCLPVGKGFLLGCQFSEDVPWNLRVWFG